MGYKLNTALKKSKTSIIIALVLWVIVTVILVSHFHTHWESQWQMGSLT